MRKSIIISFLLCKSIICISQGYNHTWLIGYNNFITKARFNIDNNIQYIIEQREMGFEGTQGNISDENGNFLMSSNGVYIANANNDTMFNGSGLNPGSFVNSWNQGLPLPHANVILPWPDSSHKYILLHQTFNGTVSQSNELYYSIIDMTLDNGLGAVVEKNTIFDTGYFAWGINTSRHANGRDWWIVALSDSIHKTYTYLLTPNGLQFHADYVFSSPSFPGTSGQAFSPDGKKFAFTNVKGNTNMTYTHELKLLEFDRCNGSFSNPVLMDISDTIGGRGVSFSPNSKYLYVTKFDKVLQFNTDTTDILNSKNVVAVYDGFKSPGPSCCATDFWSMFLAANGKIYITSGSSVQHHHFINNPNLEDTLCDVQQHALDLNGIWSYRAIPNHPNYYLGCDITCTPCLVSVNEVEHDFKFSVFPNPSNGDFRIMYLLPQNKEGLVEVFDINGKVVYSYNLPQWSTLQQFNLSDLSLGIYAVKISSDRHSVVKKLIVTK